MVAVVGVVVARGVGGSLDCQVRRTLDVGQRVVGQPTQVDRPVLRRPVGLAADRLVVGVHVVPRESPGGGGTAMELVERALAEQDDQLDVLERAGATEQIVVRQAPGGECEALVEATQLLPAGAVQEEAVALAHGPEDAPPRRARQCGDGEQAVAVVLPTGTGEQLVLDLLVVAHLGRAACG